ARRAAPVVDPPRIPHARRWHHACDRPVRVITRPQPTHRGFWNEAAVRFDRGGFAGGARRGGRPAIAQNTTINPNVSSNIGVGVNPSVGVDTNTNASGQSNAPDTQSPGASPSGSATGSGSVSTDTNTQTPSASPPLGDDTVKQDDKDRAWMERQRHAGRKPATIARRLAALRGLYAHLVREGAIAENPTEYVEQPRRSRPLPRTLSREAVTALVEAPDVATARGVRDRAL